MEIITGEVNTKEKVGQRSSLSSLNRLIWQIAILETDPFIEKSNYVLKTSLGSSNTEERERKQYNKKVEELEAGDMVLSIM